MSHPFDARARSSCFGRAVGRFHRGFISIAGKIDEDITQRGWGGLPRHPKVPEAFRLVNGVVDEMLQFEAKAAAHALSHLKVRGVCEPTDAYSEDHEKSLIDWLNGTLDGAPTRILEECRRLPGTPCGLEDIADLVKNDVQHRVRRASGEGRAQYQLEVEGLGPRETTTFGDRKSWTQAEVDAEIERLKKVHKDFFDGLAKRVAEGDSGVSRSAANPPSPPAPTYEYRKVGAYYCYRPPR